MSKKIYLNDLPRLLFSNPSTISAFAPSSFIKTSTSLDELKLRIAPLPSIENKKHEFKIYLGSGLNSLTCKLALANAVVRFGDDLSGNIRANCWHGSYLKIAHKTSMSQMRVVLDRSCSCSIGSDCLISDGVLLQVGDQHAIFDINSKCIINHNSSLLSIADHVWLGRNSTILSSSDVSIGSGSIVGLGALVTKSMPQASLIVGTPAKVLRENVSWHRSASPDSSSIDDVICRYTNG